MGITHATTAVGTDAGTGEIHKAEWNAEHLITGLGVAFIGARAYRTTSQTVTAGVETAMTFDAEEFDTDTFHDNSTNPSRMTIPAGLGGKYLVQSHLGFPGASHGVIFGRIKKNGTTFITGSEDDLSTGSDSSLHPGVVIDLAAGDYVEIFASRASGTAIGATTNSFSNTFEIVKLDSGKVGQGIGAKAYASGTQSITNTTISPITFNTDEFDTDAFHDVGSNTNRFTIPAGLGGKYLLNANAGWDTNATASRFMWFRKNGADVQGTVDVRPGSATVGGGSQVSAVLDLVPTDWVEVVVYQDSGGTRTLGNAGGDTKFRATMSIMRLDSGSATLGLWQDFTPTISASTTPPTLGSSTLTGRYKYLDSKTLFLSMTLTVTTGGSWNAGSGSWQFLFLALGVLSAARRQTLTAEVNDASTRHYTATGIVVASDNKVGEVVVADASGAHIVTNTVPITWATGDTVCINGMIELA